MANWCGSARSSYVKVKDVDQFQYFCGLWQVEHIEHDGKQGFLCGDDGLPTLLSTEDNPDQRCLFNNKEWDQETFFFQLSQHLVKGQVIILMEVGAEKLRYITGWAIAIDWNNKQKDISLGRINDIADKMGEFTDCSY